MFSKTLPGDIKIAMAFVGMIELISDGTKPYIREFVRVDKIVTEELPFSNSGCHTWPMRIKIPKDLPNSHVFATKERVYRLAYEIRVAAIDKGKPVLINKVRPAMISHFQLP